jgi:hypothetical protein
LCWLQHKGSRKRKAASPGADVAAAAATVVVSRGTECSCGCSSWVEV